MTSRVFLFFVFLVSLRGQQPDSAFFSWHAFDYTFLERPLFDVTAQLHFRTRNHFSTFNLLRGSLFASVPLPKGFNTTGGYLRQSQESRGDEEWARQQRFFASISRPFTFRRIRHTPRLQYDYLYAMRSPAYGRYRLFWQTEWTGRVRPYAAIEQFVENAGVQRLRPRIGVRFQPASILSTDIVYMYDRIYLRGDANRHILQTTFSFHRPRKD